ncbi:tetratricopeptide repeat protein [Chlorobium limicola]
MKHIGSLFNKALQDYRAGRFWPAEKGLRALLKAEPGHAGALGFLGALLLEQGKEAEGFRMMERSLRADPRQPDVLNNYGYFLRKFNRFDEALEAYDRSLLLRPSFVEGLSNRGDVLFELGRYEEAEKSCELALAMNPSYSAAWYNLGNARQKLDNHFEAVQNYSKAIMHGAIRAEVYCNMGNSLRELGRFEEALTAYAEALRLDKSFFLAWYNQGVLLHSMRRYEEALISYRKGLELNGEHVESYSDLGVTFYELGWPDQAIECYDHALSLKPDFAHAWQNKGILYDRLRRFEEALTCYAHAVELEPDLVLALSNWIFSKMKLCDWDGLDSAVDMALERLDKKEALISPHTLNALTSSQMTLYTNACIWTHKSLFRAKSYTIRTIRHERIRIGYFSSDFREHPVSFLSVGMFEQHNRKEFEIFGFSLESARDDVLRKRVIAGFENFIDISKMGDAEALNEIRKLGLNIAIDLNGHTGTARMSLFKNRLAPIQVNYLGFAGTMGADFIDYVIGDRVTIPEEHKALYTEKVVYMPHTLQANDSKREISSRAFSRSECGLPENGFVFCSFLGSYKITRAMFGIWMDLLDRVKDSVLWLARNPDEHVIRLQAEARRCGIDPDRLVFAEGLPSNSEHLARYRLADLVLDSSPFGGCTTTSDALWAGAPLLTLKGETYVGRMSASLLFAIGLPELVTQSPEAYVRRAVELAENRDELQEIRDRLTANRTTSPVFDTALFTRNIEQAYHRMWDRHLAGLPPDHIVV